MFPVIASLVDFVHAIFMVLWVAGLPLLFTRKYPRATRWYARYAIGFIVLNQASRFFLGECFLTTVARFFWQHGGGPIPAEAHEWFTVRLAFAVFRMAPSHRAITILSEILIFVCAAGMLVALRRRRLAELPAAPRG
ncbi:Hypothetical protein A7982_09310 [Minicystis rosea]|nr:Hypothetical protein A7982_09310 [Minicystis rosea]